MRHPGFVHGGTIASVVDCHAIWAAIEQACRSVGHDLAEGPPPFGFVTGRLSVNFRRPVRIDGEMELRARVVEPGERKMLVACRVLQNGQECADAEVLAVRVAAPG